LGLVWSDCGLGRQTHEAAGEDKWRTREACPRCPRPCNHAQI
jgi:hypothetical protein